ncbi:hypothetical protein NADFUDRAFT_83888 [Nadsonia fulvescens var. elongata DSM 6958]|uniref:ATP synthase F(0) complex subunit e, mitochondrial n=1 Tax=Nadsonia fulvescens var. elongata DSM 6958 TaxID=857566 RepID=A0A1E3PG50_9ASCO|nr:hypothetical protein NADFUDRAFT_83888 [Nadsonia fulvescens var. elongata DSM 6958]
MSSTFNVFRWSALAAGVYYGYKENRARNSAAVVRHEAQDWARKEQLIKQAKAEWVKLNPVKTPAGVVSDIEDPNFDIEKYIDHSLKQFA